MWKRGREKKNYGTSACRKEEGCWHPAERVPPKLDWKLLAAEKQLRPQSCARYSAPARPGAKLATAQLPIGKPPPQFTQRQHLDIPQTSSQLRQPTSSDANVSRIKTRARPRQRNGRPQQLPLVCPPPERRRTARGKEAHGCFPRRVSDSLFAFLVDSRETERDLGWSRDRARGGRRLENANTCANRLFGFLFGTVVAGSGVYTYLLQEYKASNDLLTEDIYVRILAGQWFFGAKWGIAS